MKKLFVDTNVVLDLLAQREEYLSAAQLFTLGDKCKVSLHVSSLSFSTIHYVLRKLLGNDETMKVLRDLELLVEIAALDAKIIQLALNDDDFNDFEDALQYYSALAVNADVIITRNLKDFRSANVPTLTAGQYLALRN